MEEEFNPYAKFANEENPYEKFAPNASAQNPSVAERTVSLPMPRPNMFAEMPDKDAQMTYDAYKRHPDTQQDDKGNLIYKGQVVPKPEGNSGIAEAFARAGQILFSGMSPETAAARRKALGESPNELDTSENIGRGLGGGALNTGRNVVETVAAAVTPPELPKFFEGTAADKAMTDFRTGVAEGLEDNLPKFNPEGTTQSVANTGTQIVGGIILGNRAMASAKAAGVGATAMNALATKLPRAASYLTEKFVSGLTSGAGTAVTVDDQSDTLAVGENSLAQEKLEVPILQGVDTDSPDEMNNMINRRVNVLLDNMLIAMPIEAGADGGRKALGFVYTTFFEPIQAAFSKNKKSQMIIQDIMDAVGLAADSTDPNSPVAQAAKQKVVDIMQTEEFRNFYAEAQKQGIDDVAFRRDTAGAIETGLAGDASEEADSVRHVFNEYRKKAIEDANSGYRSTVTAAERPVKATENYLKQSEELFGGDRGIDQSAGGIRTQAQKEVQAGELAAADAENEARKAVTELPDKLREGPMGDAITEAEMSPIGAQRLRRNQVATDILEAERAGTASIDETSRANWKNIPEGLEADADSFTQTIIDAADAEELTPRLKKALEKMGFDPENEDMVLDFKQLQGLRKTLTDEITRLRSGATPQPTGALEAIRNNINKVQPEFVIEEAGKKGQEGAEALKKAVNYEKDVRGPVTKQGLPRELRQIRGKPQDRFAPVDVEDASRRALHKTLTSDQPAVASHFVDTLSRPEYGAVHDKVVDYAFADAGDKLFRKIKSGEGLTSINPDDILSTLEPYRQIMNANPEKFGPKLKELNDFYESVVKNKNNVKALEDVAKSKMKDLEKLKTDIYEVKLKEFFEKNGDPKPNAFNSLSELYRNPQATGRTEAGRLDNVIRLAKESGDPMILDGMKAAWMKTVRDSIFQTSESAGGKAMSIKNVDDFLGGTGKADLLTVGQKLFADEPQLVGVIQQILEPAMNTAIARKSGASTVGKNTFINDAKEAVAAGVRLWKGPLTREGTQINTAFGKLVNFFVSDKGHKAALDAVMADPEGFMKAYRDFIRVKTPGKERPRAIFKWLVNQGIYNEGDQNRWDKEMKRLETEAQTEEALNKK